MADGSGLHEVKAEVLDALKANSKEIHDKLAKIDDEIKTHGKVQEETKGEFTKLSEKQGEITNRLDAIEQEVVARGKGQGGQERVKSVGEMFAESEDLKEYIKRGGKGTSAKFELKAITSGPTSAGPGVYSDRLAGVIEDPLRPLSIRDLLDKGTTGSNLIEWIREDVFTNNAAPAPETTLKPESNITYKRVDVPVRTIAHFIVASKQILADMGQLQTLVNGRLSYGLKIKEEDQLLTGDGTGENILGLIPQATAFVNPLGTSIQAQNKADVLRAAILQVYQAYYPATGIVLNPQDWASIQLLKNTQNSYLFGGPTSPNGPTLWGLPVAESFALAPGEFMVGSFRLAATLFDREQAGLYISNEDRDNFVKNMVTILAEERLALGVSRPKAFVHGSFPTTP